MNGLNTIQSYDRSGPMENRKECTSFGWISDVTYKPEKFLSVSRWRPGALASVKETLPNKTAHVALSLHSIPIGIIWNGDNGTCGMAVCVECNLCPALQIYWTIFPSNNISDKASVLVPALPR